MTIKDLVINVSNLIWTDEVEKAWVKRSAFVIQNVTHPHAGGVIGNDRYNYFDIYCGTEKIEYGLTGRPVYLAAITGDGRYRLERLEEYIKERDGKLVFDVLDLPDQINGLRFQKAADFRNSPWERIFNRPHDHVAFRTEGGAQDIWTIEGWSTLTFVIGPSSTGKSRFIAENFRDCGYTILDVLDYQRQADKDKNLKSASPWERLYRANERLKADLVQLVRQGRNVVVEQTFLRALRRIDCIDAVHKVSRKIPIEVYVMMPSEERLRQNCMTRWGYTQTELEWDIKRIKRESEQIFEFPNPAEGFSKIYIVSDDSITLRMDEPDWSLPQRAWAELREEAEKRAKAKEESERLKRLLKEAARIRNSPEGMPPSGDTKTGR